MNVYEWLGLLPEPISSKAIKYTKRGPLSRISESYLALSLEDALSGAFRWNDTSEGYWYWDSVHKTTIVGPAPHSDKPRVVIF